MENVLLVRYGEIHLKGLNRPFFERKLVEGIKHALSDLGATVRMEQGRIFVLGIKDKDRDEAVDRLTRVFGIHSISPAIAVEKEWDAIADSAMELMRRALGESRSATFKVMARRADKRFPMNSEQINRELGHVLLENFPGLSVDVHSPKIKMCVEIREKAYLYCEEIPGANGMPTGTAGRAALLISGGIDSPVAGYLMAKRGLELSAVHFYSYPYTSERARDKVVDLTGLVARYSGPIRLHLVPFTEIQLEISKKCIEDYFTIIMRRMMMRIAQRVAEQQHCGALITGESLGQVASQTMEALGCTQAVCYMPVFRPAIGLDKEEIIDIARKIGTFETSSLPYEDCCTVFTPRHPQTKPRLEKVEEQERRIDVEGLVERAVAGIERVTLG